MKIATQVVGALAMACTIMGFFPCLGWINWVAAPLALATVILGIVGLTTEAPEDKVLYIVELTFGLVLVGVSTFRCLAGGGVV